MITQDDIESAQAQVDKAQAALLAYAERGDDQPTDIDKHNALAEQLKSAIRNFERLVAARLRGE
jgi:peptidoglycan hydrolase CwlO-like protein